MVSVILTSFFDLPEANIPRIQHEHQLSMAAENLVGELLERYLASVLEPAGWVWCSGSMVKAVDFIKPPDKTTEEWELLQARIETTLKTRPQVPFDWVPGSKNGTGRFPENPDQTGLPFQTSIYANNFQKKVLQPSSEITFRVCAETFVSRFIRGKKVLLSAFTLFSLPGLGRSRILQSHQSTRFSFPRHLVSIPVSAEGEIGRRLFVFARHVCQQGTPHGFTQANRHCIANLLIAVGQCTAKIPVVRKLLDTRVFLY